jgi:hypothetical protein
MVGAMVWTFTRRNSFYPDRLFYEAFVSGLLDRPRRTARCHQPGPFGHADLSLKLRHRMVATATMFFGAPGARLAQCGIAPSQQAYLAAWR